MDSRLFSMVSVAAIIVAILIYVRWRIKVNHAFAMVGKWFWSGITSSKTCRVAETFCNEVAVLWFVFPLLDAIYDPAKKGKPDLLPAFLVSGLFFIFAIVLSHAGKKEKEED